MDRAADSLDLKGGSQGITDMGAQAYIILDAIISLPVVDCCRVINVLLHAA
jgi:hypothetical protein